MSGKRTPVNTIKANPDGSITLPASDLKIVQSALLWARMNAEKLAESCEKLAAADWLDPESRARYGRHAQYHAERVTQAADLEERITQAQVSAR